MIVHPLGDYLTGHSSNFMEISIPKLDGSLDLKPSQTDEQAEDYTCLIVLATNSLCGFNDIRSDNTTVWVGQNTFFNLAADDLFNLIFQSECNFSNLLGRVRRLWLIGNVGRENCGWVSMVGLYALCYDVRLRRSTATR